MREVAYDVLGRAKASRVVGDDDWTCVTYDTRGRVAAQTFPSMSNPADASLDTPARTVTNTYSVSGNPLLSHTTDTDAATAGRYPVQTLVDLLGRVVEYRDEWGYTTHNSFDQAGRLTGSVVRDPSVTVVETLGYTYNTSGDGVNQLATQTLDGVTVATVAYDTVGRATVVTYGNGTTSTVGFDGYQRPSSVTHAKGATTITSDAVTRDTRTGRIVDQSTDGTDPNPAGVNYTYDNAGRLTSWRAVDPATGHRFEGGYRFDGYTTTPAGCDAAVGRNSNRLEETRTTRDALGTVLESWTATQCADNADRLTSYQPPSGQPNPFSDPVYDHHGNLVSSGNETRGYDSADRHLVTNTIGGTATTVTYRRDVGDRVIERSVDGMVVARYAHTANGDTPALTLTPAGAVAQITVSLPGGVLLTKTSSSEVWSHPNLHGDIVATTDATGTKQGDTHAYDPFGNPLSAAGIPDNSQGAWDYGWHGQQQRPLEHQTGLTPIIEMGARQYTPLLGRFLEVDPVEGGTSNAYAYVTDPLSHHELSGLYEVMRGGVLYIGYYVLAYYDWLGRPIGVTAREANNDDKFGFLFNRWQFSQPTRSTRATIVERRASPDRLAGYLRGQAEERRRIEAEIRRRGSLTADIVGILGFAAMVSQWVGVAVGCAQGGAYGAFYGSAVPGWGTAVGGIGGCVVGGAASWYAWQAWP